MLTLSRLFGAATLAVAAMTLGDEMSKRGIWHKVATNSMTLMLMAIQSTKYQALVARDGLQDIVAEAKYIKEKNSDIGGHRKKIVACPEQAKNIMINEELGG